MPSPFPGMDPYLEGYLWPDLHRALAAELRRRLVPLIRPRYVARLETYVVEDESPELEIGVMYPDIEVLTSRQESGERASEKPASSQVPSLHPIQAPLTIPLLHSVEVKLVHVQVRDTVGNELVTSIEILSPINKREPGLSRRRGRQAALHRQRVHLLEVDLLRRGTRVLASHPRLPDTHYLVTLTRADSSRIGIWPIRLSDSLPVVPVPLRLPDPDVPLDLSSALRTVYDEAAYDLSVNYGAPPPPPPLSPEEETWMRDVLANRR